MVADADAVLGFCTADIVKAGKKLRWIQHPYAGVEKLLSEELVNSKVVLTNTPRIYGPSVADQASALLLAADTRRTAAVRAASRGGVRGAGGACMARPCSWVGLGGIGTQISRRANAFGMRVRAIDPKEMQRPDFVFSLDKPAKLMELLPMADVVVLSCPLSAETRGMIGREAATGDEEGILSGQYRSGRPGPDRGSAGDAQGRTPGGSRSRCQRSRAAAGYASAAHAEQCRPVAARREANHRRDASGNGGSSGRTSAALWRENRCCASWTRPRGIECRHFKAQGWQSLGFPGNLGSVLLCFFFLTTKAAGRA